MIFVKIYEMKWIIKKSIHSHRVIWLYRGKNCINDSFSLINHVMKWTLRWKQGGNIFAFGNVILENGQMWTNLIRPFIWMEINKFKPGKRCKVNVQEYCWYNIYIRIHIYIYIWFGNCGYMESWIYPRFCWRSKVFLNFPNYTQNILDAATA